MARLAQLQLKMSFDSLGNGAPCCWTLFLAVLVMPSEVELVDGQRVGRLIFRPSGLQRMREPLCLPLFLAEGLYPLEHRLTVVVLWKLLLKQVPVRGHAVAHQAHDGPVELGDVFDLLGGDCPCRVPVVA